MVLYCIVFVLYCLAFYCVALRSVVLYCKFTLLSLFGPCWGISALSFFTILWTLSAFRSIHIDLKLVQ